MSMECGHLRSAFSAHGSAGEEREAIAVLLSEAYVKSTENADRQIKIDRQRARVYIRGELLGR